MNTAARLRRGVVVTEFKLACTFTFLEENKRNLLLNPYISTENKDMDDVLIRPIRNDDALEIERLYNRSAEHLRSLGDETDFRFNAQYFQRDGFGENTAFSGFCASIEGKLVGYLIYTFSYDTDKAIRYLHILDLLVDKVMRNRWIGKSLMKHAANYCREKGGTELFWAVYGKNGSALKFYSSLGAEEIADLRFMRLMA